MDHLPRAVCSRCARPVSVCWCRHLPSIPTRTRVVILQHPRERHVAIGTGRMASLCLPSASLHLGVDFAADPEVAAALADPARPAALLWPGEGALDLAAHRPEGPITLVIVDGTWSQAKKVVRKNPFLARLPRYAFVPPSPSAYRIRREPRDDYVSTIEAVAHALAILEGDRFSPMMAPFAAMIDAQLDCQERLRGARLRHRRERLAERPVPVPPLLASPSLLCVAGEANAWPRRGEPGEPDELVQWVARRLPTGETFTAVVAPTGPIAPATPAHTRLRADEIAAGESFASFAARWRAFVREDDVVCAWGHYATALLVAQGGFLPRARVDLRVAAKVAAHVRPGVVDAGPPPAFFPAPLGPGRGGARLAHACEVATRLAELARDT